MAAGLANLKNTTLIHMPRPFLVCHRQGRIYSNWGFRNGPNSIQCIAWYCDDDGRPLNYGYGFQQVNTPRKFPYFRDALPILLP